jgi:hypothetical protein
MNEPRARVEDVMALPVDPAAEPPVGRAPTESRRVWHDRSGAIGAGGAAQECVPENVNRRAFFFQNTSGGDLWLDFTADAVQASPSVRVPSAAHLRMEPPGFVSTERLSVVGAGAGQTYSVKEA